MKLKNTVLFSKRWQYEIIWESSYKRLVGAEGELGAAFGLGNDWSLELLNKLVIMEKAKRNIADPGILPDRGPNQLWTKGGILYVPPAR